MSKPLSPSAMMVLRRLTRGLKTCRQLADAAHTSKQAIAWHLSKLIELGLVVPSRSTRNAPNTYSLNVKGVAAFAQRQNERGCRQCGTKIAPGVRLCEPCRQVECEKRRARMARLRERRKAAGVHPQKSFTCWLNSHGRSGE